jgi:tetratricopeptide (TPR) repeat protein
MHGTRRRSTSRSITSLRISSPRFSRLRFSRLRFSGRRITWLGCAIVAGGLAASSSTAQSPPSPAPSRPDTTRAAAIASADADTLLSAHVAAGDRAHAAMNAGAALAEYENALAIDSANYVALYKAAREAVDLGEFDTSAAARTAYYAKGLAYARRAVIADSSGADGHFHVARALGRQALSVGSKARIQYAKAVRAEALRALAIDSLHPGALHVMGVWNAEIMRLSGIQRFIARNLLGGGILGTASWREAIRYMERSVAAEPQRIVHHLDLARIYADVGDTAKAREQFGLVLSLPAADYNDPHYQKDARDQLARL